MVALYLVQHGVSLPKEADPRRGLSPEGIAEVRRIAEVAKGYGVRVKRICHSGKTRAQQTADIMADFLSPTRGVEAVEGLGPMDDPGAWVSFIDNRDDLMVVGHLPFLERLTALLVTGRMDKPVFRFQNGGIVCLTDDPDKGGWVVAWTLMPRIGATAPA